MPTQIGAHHLIASWSIEIWKAWGSRPVLGETACRWKGAYMQVTVARLPEIGQGDPKYC